MSKRTFVDRHGREWKTSGSRVGVGAASEGGRIPEPEPWIRFESGDQAFSGPSGKDLEEFDEEQLQELLDEFIRYENE
jgi:hypothetical protein